MDEQYDMRKPVVRKVKYADKNRIEALIEERYGYVLEKPLEQPVKRNAMAEDKSFTNGIRSISKNMKE